MKVQVFFIAAGFLLYGGLTFFSGKGESIKAVPRSSVAGETVSYEIEVKGLEKEDQLLTITAGQRKYSEEEAKERFDQVRQQLNTQILGENLSLKEVRTDLTLMSWSEDLGIRIRWDSEKPEILDRYGKVNNKELGPEGEPIWLKAAMTDGENQRTYEILVTVLPPIISQKEQTAEDFLKELKKLDMEQEQTDQFVLPDQYKGKELSYTYKEDESYKILPLLGIAAAVVYSLKGKQKRMEEEKIKDRQMMVDYPEIISKLTIFTGAGMTVRLSWERIVKDYEKRKSKGGQVRYAYEEMSRTYHQLQKGMMEGKAYEEFGKNCRLQPYLRLAGLIEQNRKEGVKNLRNLLSIEMNAAFEERKNLARKLGEEAGTKLLIPLFMTLGIVMIMVMLPALMAFS